MNRKSAIRAIKGVTFPDSRKTTPRAILGCVPGIDLSDDALSLHFVADHIKDHATRPDGEPSIPGFAAMLSLLKIQIFEYKNAILRSPLNELLGRTVTEVSGSTRSLDSKPFEGPDDAPSIFTRCLMFEQAFSEVV